MATGREEDCNGICIRGHEILPGGGNGVAYAHPDCLAHGDPLMAVCDDDGCDWRMPADDEEEAVILLALHRTVKAVDAAESIVEDEAGRD